MIRGCEDKIMEVGIQIKGHCCHTDIKLSLLWDTKEGVDEADNLPE